MTSIQSTPAASANALSPVQSSGEPKPPSNDDLCIVNLDKAEQIVPIAKAMFGELGARLATSGYSAAPEGYEAATTQFLQDLVGTVGTLNVGLITSPTADKGSIDAISTVVAQKAKLPVLYVTAQSYVQYIKPENFPESLNKQLFAKTPKYVFPNGAEYSKATACGSNGLLVTGGRDVAVQDFVNAIKQGNSVVVLVNEDLGGVNWDEKKKRPNNGSRYLAAMLAQHVYSGGENSAYAENLPFLPEKGFDADFLRDFGAQLKKQAKVVRIGGSADWRRAVAEAAAHLFKTDSASFS